MSRAGVIILGWTGDAHEAGIFALGLNLALFLVLPRMAVGLSFHQTSRSFTRIGMRQRFRVCLPEQLFCRWLEQSCWHFHFCC